MKANIIVIHGMRSGKQNEILHNFISKLMERSKTMVHVAFLESKSQTVESVVVKLLQQGYSEFIIMPLLIFPAKHYYEDIPFILSKLKSKYPGMHYGISKTLGTHQQMAKIIQQNILDTLKNINHIEQIVLIAHGSSTYLEPDYELKKLMQTCDVFDLPMQMLTVYGEYNYRQKIQRYLLENTSVLIVPVFLYDGYIVNKIKADINHTCRTCDIHYTNAINFPPELHKIIEERIRETEVLCCVSSTT